MFYSPGFCMQIVLLLHEVYMQTVETPIAEYLQHCRSTATMRKQHFGPFHRNIETISRQLSGTATPTPTHACVHSHSNLAESLARHPAAVVFLYMLYCTVSFCIHVITAAEAGGAFSVLSSARTNGENRLLVLCRWEGMVSQSSVFVGLFHRVRVSWISYAKRVGIRRKRIQIRELVIGDWCCASECWVIVLTLRAWISE